MNSQNQHRTHVSHACWRKALDKEFGRLMAKAIEDYTHNSYKLWASRQPLQPRTDVAVTMVSKRRPRYGWWGQETEQYCKFPIGTRVRIGHESSGLMGIVIERGTPPPGRDIVHIEITHGDSYFHVGLRDYWSEWQCHELAS